MNVDSNGWLFDEAGMSDLDSGNLGRPARLGELLVPGVVQLMGEDLVYSDQESLYRESPPDLLDQFLALRRATDEQIRQFAERWGMLRLCHDMVPWCHNVPHCYLMGAEQHVGESPDVPVDDRKARWFREPLAAWRHYAAQFFEVLVVAGKSWRALEVSLDQWSPPHTGDWVRTQGPFHFVVHGDPAKPEEIPLPTPDMCLAECVRIANENMYDGLVLPLVQLRHSGTRVAAGLEFASEACPVWGALSVQLALAVSRSGLAVCSDCGVLFDRRHPPARKYVELCGRCRRRAALRDGQQRFRDEKKKQR